MLQTVANTIAAHDMLKDCRNLIVGISGGADSVCLLSVLFAYIQEKHLSILLTAAHVNHGLRGDAADRDEAQVKALCNTLGIPLKVRHCPVAQLAKAQGISVEMAGRNARYAFFQELADALPESKIAVAHNREDRAETVLWNIIRGTGLDGLKGIPYVRDLVIRPLLDVSKTEIRNYCKANGLPVCEDATNQETDYTRNKIRLELLPYMEEKFQTDMTEKILRLSNNILPDEDYLQEQAKEAYAACIRQESRLERKAFLQLHPAMQVRVLKQFCPQLPEQVHLQKLLQFMQEATTGKQLSLPGGWKAVMQYDMLLLQRAEDVSEDVQAPVCHPAEGSFVLEPLGVKVTCEVRDGTDTMPALTNKSTTQVFDYDLLIEACNTGQNILCIRTRKEGDWIRPWKGVGKKTLKRFLIDTRIPRETRDSIPLLALGQEVLWVAGYRRCDGYLPSENTKRYFWVSLEKI